MSPVVRIIVISRDLALEKDAFTYITLLEPSELASRAPAHFLGEKGPLCT